MSRFALGFLAGLALILIASLIEYEVGWLHFVRVDTSSYRGVSKPLMMLLQLAPSVAVGISEETGFRTLFPGARPEYVSWRRRP